MKRIKFFSIALTATALGLLFACSDDMGVQNYSDGMLHFQFLFDKQGQWNEDGKQQSQTRMMAPVEMTSPDGFDMPLYLHCVESNTIETAAETRGERITGEAFDDRNKVTSFGLYAVVDGQQVLATSSAELTASYTEIKRDELSPSGGWQVRETTLNFAGDEGWPDGETGDFYGFAPFPGWDADEDAGNGHARCILIDTDSPTPTITFFMQPEEEHNKDILAAKKTGVTYSQKDSGIEMPFKHILSALKFNLDAANDLKYTVGVGGTEYYLQVKSITVEGIYDEGTVGIGETNWTHETTTGSCTAVLNRSYSTVTGDADKLINTDEHCMMVLPQTAPTGAKIIITVDLTSDAAGATVFKEDVTFEASLAGLTWQPGYSYTYQITKDTRAKSYTLTSEYGGVNGGTFSFDSEGGSLDFDVLSNVELKEGTSPSVAQPTKWHLEYSTDGGATFQQGLPLGLSVVRKSTGEQVDDELAILNSSTAAETYTITAEERVDELPTISTLTSHDYNQYADNDGYYDLSLHPMGYSAAICGHTSARNTANCYIINGFGKFKLPLVYGNGVKQGVNNPKAYAYTWSDSYGTDMGHGVFLDHTGNQINDPWITAQVGAMTGAEIVWEENNVINPNSVELSDDGDYLCFEIEKSDVQPSNALLAVRDANGIAWSWHIWVTAFDFANNITELSCNVNGTTRSAKFAQRNLGWRTPEIKNYHDHKTIKVRVAQNDPMGEHVDHSLTQDGGVVSLSGANLIYQNGRKDPFPYIRMDLTGFTTNSTTGALASVSYANKDLFTQEGCTYNDSDQPSADYSIKNPTSFIAHGTANNSNWFKQNDAQYPGRQGYPCWDPEGSITYGAAKLNAINYGTHTKTIYDPCPVGFMVPKSGALVILNYTSYTSESNNTPRSWSYKTTTTTLDGEEVNAPLGYITNGDMTFYLTGGMTYNWTTGGATFTTTGTNTYGYIWSTGLFSNASYSVYGRASSSGFQDMAASTPNRYSFYGFPVRPVVDELQGTIEAWDSEPVQNFHQGDVEGVVLTETSTGNWGIQSSSMPSVVFDVKDVNGNHVTNLALNNFLTDSSKKNKRVYIKNVHVEFTYNGYTYGVIVPRTLQRYSIVYTNGTRTETHDSRANVDVSTIPDHYQFSAQWTRWNPADITNTATWEGLVPLTTQRVNITKVTADLRVTYTD